MSLAIGTSRTARTDRRRLTLIAEAEPGDVCGFIQAIPRTAASAEITFAAVRRSLRRSGVGRALLAAAFRELEDNGIVLVEVKTLDASAGYEPYVATRAFWESHGFVQVDTIDPLPGWEPGNPAAIYVASLKVTAEPAATGR